MNLLWGEVATRVSAGLVVVCYLSRVFTDVYSASRHRGVDLADRARWYWTAGCVLCVLHIVFAFTFHHQWSHQRAYEHTARQTAAIAGVDWGGGLYVNYAFMLLWIADVAVWWGNGVGFPYRRPRYFWTIHLVFAFMIFNATVLFGPPMWKWIALIVGLGLLATAFRRPRQSPRSAADDPS